MMKTENHRIFQCINPECVFRFPAGPHDPALSKCPKCGRPLESFIYAIPPVKNESDLIPNGKPEIHALLDNIRSIFNVGSIFRTADGSGIKSLFLCGITPTPDHPKLSKTGLGAEWSIPWSFSNNAVITAETLKKKSMTLWALEDGAESIPLPDCLDNLPTQPLLLIVGNEISGIDPLLRHLCDKTVFIPMQGYKRSLNVAIAFSIAAYFLKYREVNNSPH